MSDQTTTPATGLDPDRDGEQRIRDRASFESLGGAGKELAALYTYAQLDVLVELARLVSLDFFARPELYITLADDSLDKKLAALHARYGYDEELPSTEQRQRIYEPLFGGDFMRHRDELLAAAAVYAEWTQNTGLQMVEASVRTMHHAFKEWLLGVSGASSRWSRWQAIGKLADDTCYPVLRDSGVTGVFGVATAAVAGWPYQIDANGDKTVEQISRDLDKARPPVTRQRFSDLQRVALRGAEAIAAVLDFDSEDPDDAALRAMITRCYVWYTALARVQPVAIAASPAPVTMPAGLAAGAVSNGSSVAVLPA